MYLFFIYPLLLVILHHGVWAVEQVIMQKYEGVQSSGSSDSTYDTSPTWRAIVKIPGEAQLNFQGVRDYAQSAWNSIKDADRFGKTGTKQKLLSALYIPQQQTIYFGTVPLGPIRNYITINAQMAPVWLSKVQSMWKPDNPNAGGKNFWHCEDHVYFLYETQGKGEGITEGHYPDNLLVTYGSFGDNKDGVVDLCSTVSSRRPKPCQPVAQDLHVNFLTKAMDRQLGVTVAESPAGNPDPEAGTAADDPGGLEVVQFCPSKPQKRDSLPALRGRTLQSRGTSSQASCIPLPTSLNLPASTVQLNIPTSDFSSPSSATSPPGGSSTQNPTTGPSCVLHNNDPDQSISSPFCLCDATLTLPLRSAPATAPATVQCAYTTIESSAIITSKPSLAVTTNTESCQVCTRVVNNEDSCSSIKGCTVKSTSPSPTDPPTTSSAATQSGAAVTVEAGRSPVHLGTLTGKALSTSVSSALAKICPTPSKPGAQTACATDSVIIKNIPYVSAGFLAQGELVISVESSSYNRSELRKAMIDTAANTAMQAATGKNCYNTTYRVSSIGRRDLSLFDRRETPTSSEETDTWCNTVGFAGVQYFDPWWKQQAKPGVSDWIDARWAFEIGPGGGFDCALLMELTDAFAVLMPEFIVEDVALGEEIAVACEEAFGKK